MDCFVPGMAITEGCVRVDGARAVATGAGMVVGGGLRGRGEQ